MPINIPTAEFQLLFLKKIRHLLDEGSFSSTYKYALLITLADLSVEFGQDNGDSLELSINDIAKKFIVQYWGHSKPYSNGKTLFQNSNKQAAIIHTTNYTFPNMEKNVVAKVASTVKKMPLWKLQCVHGEIDEFLYAHTGEGNTITLLSGVMYCFRKFHDIVASMVRGEWVACVRSFKKNVGILGFDNLQNFLFGSQRADLTLYVDLLEDLQERKCFYCEKGIRSDPHVDHFIPWSRYPHDLGHNFVLAHKSCNCSKRDMLASVEHLENWAERNKMFGSQMENYFMENNLLHDLKNSVAIAKWAYSQAEDTESHLWVESKVVIESNNAWKSVLA
jgi:hypothetical protein